MNLAPDKKNILSYHSQFHTIQRMDQPGHLQGLSNLTPQQWHHLRLAREVLLYWQVLSFLVCPLGFIIGIGGSIGVINTGGGEGDQWNHSSVEDWVGVVFWFINAIGFVVVPLLWGILCVICRNHLNARDITGAYLGVRLCRWLWVVEFCFVSGVMFGLGKAVYHGRSGEYWWWFGFICGAAVFFIAVEWTKKILLNATKV